MTCQISTLYSSFDRSRRQLQDAQDKRSELTILSTWTGAAGGTFFQQNAEQLYPEQNDKRLYRCRHVVERKIWSVVDVTAHPNTHPSGRYNYSELFRAHHSHT